MYDIRLINPLRQFGTVCWTLTFSDPTDLLPSIRVDKKYRDDATEQFICQDVAATLSAMIYDATRPPVEVDENGEPLPQGDGVMVQLQGEILFVDDVGGVQTAWQI